MTGLAPLTGVDRRDAMRETTERLASNLKRAVPDLAPSVEALVAATSARIAGDDPDPATRAAEVEARKKLSQWYKATCVEEP